MPTPRPSLAGIATRHQVFLERLKAGKAKDLASIFNEVDKQVRAITGKLEVDKLSDLSRTKLTAMLKELDQVNTETLNKGTKSLFDDLQKLNAYEVGFELRTLEQVVKHNFTAPNYAVAYSDALKQPLSATGQLLETFVDGWTSGEVTRINNVVQKAWGEGWTVGDLTRSIRGTKALNYSDGIIATSRRNAEAVARTSIQHIASMGRAATWEANRDVILGYIYIATLDSKTTQVCRSLDHHHFKLGEGPMPPVHIGCRSTTIADLDPALDFLDEGATRASKDGPVAADLSYYDWLKTQDSAFIKEAIGATRAKLFEDGGLTADEFAKLNLGRNFQPLTLDQMQQLEPLAFKRAGIPTQ